MKECIVRAPSDREHSEAEDLVRRMIERSSWWPEDSRSSSHQSRI